MLAIGVASLPLSGYTVAKVAAKSNPGRLN